MKYQNYNPLGIVNVANCVKMVAKCGMGGGVEGVDCRRRKDGWIGVYFKVTKDA